VSITRSISHALGTHADPFGRPIFFSPKRKPFLACLRIWLSDVAMD
jgi:hypothetical protein